MYKHKYKLNADPPPSQKFNRVYGVHVYVKLLFLLEEEGFLRSFYSYRKQFKLRID